jgi:hypothetical protein
MLIKVKAFPALIIPLMLLPLHAEDWKTTDGTVYQDVKVIKVEDDAVTILYEDGGARIPLTKLPPDLQKKFSYDPVKAKAAADARAKADAESAKNLQAERDLAAKQQLQQAIQNDQARTRAEAAVQGQSTNAP